VKDISKKTNYPTRKVLSLQKGGGVVGGEEGKGKSRVISEGKLVLVLVMDWPRACM